MYIYIYLHKYINPNDKNVHVCKSISTKNRTLHYIALHYITLHTLHMHIHIQKHFHIYTHIHTHIYIHKYIYTYYNIFIQQQI